MQELIGWKCKICGDEVKNQILHLKRDHEKEYEEYFNEYPTLTSEVLPRYFTRIGE